MGLVFIIGLSAIIYGIIFYLNDSRKNTLKAENKIIDRDAVFFSKRTFF